MREECFQFDSTKHRRCSPGTLVSSRDNTGSIRDYSYWTSRENSLELTELSSINIVSLVLVWVSSRSNTGSTRDDSYWSSRENSLELKESFRDSIFVLLNATQFSSPQERSCSPLRHATALKTMSCQGIVLSARL